jgi:hypothetical protein
MSEIPKEYRLTPSQSGWVVGSMIWLGAVAAGFGVGNMIDEGNERIDVKVAAEYAETVDSVRANRDEAAHSLDRVQTEIPEACEVFLDRYLAGNELAQNTKPVEGLPLENPNKGQSDINQAVEDTLREPGQPCGDSASDIRLDITRLDTKRNTLLSAEAMVTETDKEQSRLNEVADEKDRNQGARGWMIAGGVLGFIGGCMGGFSKMDSRERKS